MQASQTEGRRVAVLGVGTMGTAIAKALAKAGHHVTIWNRSAERMAGLMGLCSAAATAAEACAAAELTFACFSTLDATSEVLRQPGVIEALKGKALVQIATATADAVVAFQRHALDSGIDFLDAKIAVTPGQIGAPSAVIFFAGPRAVFAGIEPVLKALAGCATFMGERIDAAVQGDFAFLSVYFAGTIGILHGAAFCKASGLELDQFFGLIPRFLDEINARSLSFKMMVLASTYVDVQSALDTDLSAARLLASATAQAGLHHLFPNALVALMQDAVAQGLGRSDSAAMVEAFTRRRTLDEKMIQERTAP
jgi:3-hydroxyisobutyrate dehydrogenase-like beta-hydroxyacid dehydrogenase